MTALMYAAGSGMVDCVKFLVTFGEEVRKQNEDGNTALMFAAMNGFADCVKILIPYERGLKNNEGQDALYFARLNNHKDCIKLLDDSSDSGFESVTTTENEEIASLRTELNNCITANEELKKEARTLEQEQKNRNYGRNI